MGCASTKHRIEKKKGRKEKQHQQQSQPIKCKTLHKLDDTNTNAESLKPHREPPPKAKPEQKWHKLSLDKPLPPPISLKKFREIDESPLLPPAPPPSVITQRTEHRVPLFQKPFSKPIEPSEPEQPKSPSPCVDNHKTEDADTRLKRMLRAVGQDKVKSWDEMDKEVLEFAKRLPYQKQGAFSNVYSSRLEDESIILKIIPVSRRNRPPFGKYNDLKFVENEVQCMAQVKKIGLQNPSMPQVMDLSFYEGKLPNKLKKCKPTLLQTLPFPEWERNPLYLVMIMKNHGTSLGRVRIRSLRTIQSILCQVLVGLECMEKSVYFEHRDLHSGNVLVERIADPYLVYQSGSKRVKVETYGVRATIIDFTYARLTCGHPRRSYYLNLNQNSGQFDSNSSDPVGIARVKMRDMANGDWSTFNRQSNACFAFGLVRKMVENARCSYFVKKEMNEWVKELEGCTTVTEMLECVPSNIMTRIPK